MSVSFSPRALKALAVTAIAGTCLLLSGRAPVMAEPAFTGDTTGKKIYAHGHVKVEIEQSYSGFSNAIFLLSPNITYIGQDEWTSHCVDLGTFTGCQELVFGILSPASAFS